MRKTGYFLAYFNLCFFFFFLICFVASFEVEYIARSLFNLLAYYAVIAHIPKPENWYTGEQE